MGNAPTSSQANNTNTTTNNTSVNDIGFTGQNAVDIIRNLSDNASWANFYANNTAQNATNQGASLANQFAQLGAATAAGFGANQVENARLGYTFGSDTITSSLAVVDRVSARSSETLANQINAVRDFTQRGFNAGLGATAPIQSLPAATSSVPVFNGSESGGGMVWIIVAIAALFFLGS